MMRSPTSYVAVVTILSAIAACAGGAHDASDVGGPDAVDDTHGLADAANDGHAATDAATSDVAADTTDTTDTTDATREDTAPPRFRARVMTFNTGTGARPDAALAEAYGWTPDAADLGDEWYGNGLAWVALIEAMAPWMAERSADIIAFQEIFWPGECASIPEDAHAGFVCANNTSLSVAERLVGTGYAVACHPGRPDKCIAVRRAFAQIDGCDDTFCPAAMDGALVEGCGSGSRVARASLTRPDGTSLTVVSVHGTSGFSADDTACRVGWFDAAFAGLDPSTPTLVLGDFNTDPARASDTDASAARLAELVTSGGFTFVTDVGIDARPTYGGILNIDHVIAGSGDGSCLAAGLDDTLPAPLAVEAFDHRPIVCEVEFDTSPQ